MTDDLAKTLRDVLTLLDRRGIEHMLVGSMAALAHGRSRATQDFDLVARLERAQVKPLLAELDPARFYFSPEAALEAVERESLFNVIDIETGWKVDIIPLKRRAFSQTEFARRTRVSLLGLDVVVASLEDTILAKLEWSKLGGGSARQLEDVRELVALGMARLDSVYVATWAQALGVDEVWRDLFAEAAPR